MRFSDLIQEMKRMDNNLTNVLADYQARKKANSFFDINCWLDFTDTEKFHDLDSVGKLTTWLADKGIARAVITHSESFRYEPYIGNDNLAPIIKDSANLYGGMVLTPEILYNGLQLATYVQDKIKQKFVIARFFPKKYYHSMADFAVGQILDYLQDIKLPVMIWHGEASWEEVDSICHNHPGLPLIIDGNPTKLLYHNRNYIALLEAHPNLYIEAHGLIQFEELDWLVSRFGAERIIFGSYAPYNDPDVTMANICYSQMDPDSQNKISGQNLDRLISQINT
jgi:predicted TIM-barrel fold metal-dependent hydrolase